ncbi:transposable element Tc1 transposase [Trichonephila clavipes]|uniref:Transposable element Tc1 transposase n=1 Tax=Trichonephila clavipes TaxID=2585209 RepID=A0A8X6VIL6_TRICX|nr:transposable element Tc1 transposase [Trichonephila clavipes]
MPLRRRRSHYQQLTEIQRGRVIGLKGAFFPNIAERLGRNVTTVHDCWKKLLRNGSALVPILSMCWSEGGQRNVCLWPSHGLGSLTTPEVMVWGEISYDSRSTLMDTASPHIVVVTQRALQSVDMLPWLLRDQQICFQLRTFGILLDDNSSLIHIQQLSSQY